MNKKLTIYDVRSLDDWIKRLYEGKILTEVEVKSLCERVAHT